jgi:DNA-binding transcriptional ArsR family regulator
MSLQLTMRALSDTTRREILNLLKKDAMTATSIAEHFDMSAPAISKHLNILKEAELVRCRRDGKYLIYELNASVLEEVLLWLRDIKEGTM